MMLYYLESPYNEGWWTYSATSEELTLVKQYFIDNDKLNPGFQFEANTGLFWESEEFTHRDAEAVLTHVRGNLTTLPEDDLSRLYDDIGRALARVRAERYFEASA